MRILAIDSSGLVATVAVVEEENEISKTIAEYTINYKKTHSQTLLPMLDEIVKMTDMNLDTIDAIAVAGGPGSFTGLRIGSATAKGLGLALKKPLIHIPTVDGLAYNLCYTDRIICPIMDARRNQDTGLSGCISSGARSCRKYQGIRRQISGSKDRHKCKGNRDASAVL